MNLETLKNSLEVGELNFSLLILIDPFETVLSQMYLDKIIHLLPQEPTYLESLDNFKNNRLFNTKDFSWILRADRVSFNDSYNLEQGDKGIIICKELDYSGDKYTPNIVTMPNIENWFTADYVNSICTNSSEKLTNKIILKYNNNLFQLYNEMEKILLFPEEYRASLINELYGDLIVFNGDLSFVLSNAIFRYDLETIKSLLVSKEYLNIDPFKLLNLLITGFKRVLSIQLSNSITPESLGISLKQYNAIKYYNINKYSNHSLINIYRILLGIDKKLKTGELNKNLCIDYIIGRILSI